MARGGRRTPNDQTPVVSGPGAFSRRSDGRQPIDVPNVGDSTDLQQGDRQRLEAAQRVASVPRTASPRVQPPAPTPGSPTSSGGGGAALPPHLFGGETTRPEEPITEGMPFGPGGGPDALTPPPPQDNRELMLNFLATTLGNEDAAQMLADYRNERVVPEAPMVAEPAPNEAPVEEEAVGMEDELALPDEGTPVDEVAVEGDEEGLSVETPEAAPPPTGGGEPSATLPTSSAV